MKSKKSNTELKDGVNKTIIWVCFSAEGWLATTESNKMKLKKTTELYLCITKFQDMFIFNVIKCIQLEHLLNLHPLT